MNDAEKKLLDEALHQQQLGNFPQAKKICEEILALDPINVYALHLLGMIYSRLGDTSRSISHLEKALSINPSSAVLHNHLANLLAKSNKIESAIKHYHKALKIDPQYFDAHQNLGLLFLKQGQLDAAVGEFNNVLRIFPDYFPARFYLANILLEQNKIDEAIEAYLEVLRLEPKYLDALSNLGAAYLKKGDQLEAIKSFSTALRHDESNVISRNNLAATLLQQERYIDAVWHYKELLRFAPHDLEGHYNLGVALMALGELTEAIPHFAEVLKANPKYIDAITNMGVIQLRLGNKLEGIQFFQKSLEIKPDNPPVQYLIDALTGKASPESAPAEYVKTLFDDYAARFEKHVTEQLHYHVPTLLRKLLDPLLLMPKTQWRILDLGCGTGLSGEAFKDLASYRVGVDLSSKMIDIARAKNIYDELIVEDMLKVLMQRTNQFDLIIAADVFVYVGNLSGILQACYLALHSQGMLVFSTEVNSINNSYILQPSARYAHAKKYLEDIAKNIGFSIAAFDKTVIRDQENKPLEGQLFVLKKS